MAEDEAPWFTVLPAAQRNGKVIKVPLTYLEAEPLIGARVFIFGDQQRGRRVLSAGRFSCRILCLVKSSANDPSGRRVRAAGIHPRPGGERAVNALLAVIGIAVVLAENRADMAG
jgi:hypothetical protein